MEDKKMFTVIPDIDEIVEERGNTLLRLATVSWNGRQPKLELRKWMINSSGELVPHKGVTFPSKETVDELTHVLLRNGYGDGETIQAIMEERGIEIKPKKEIEEGVDYYDPAELTEA